MNDALLLSLVFIVIAIAMAPMYFNVANLCRNDGNKRFSPKFGEITVTYGPRKIKVAEHYSHYHNKYWNLVLYVIDGDYVTHRFMVDVEPVYRKSNGVIGLVHFKFNEMKTINVDMQLKEPSGDETVYIEKIVPVILQSDAFIARYNSVWHF